MKYFFITLFVLSYVFTSSAQSKNETAIIKTNTFCDHCKECETCGVKMETELSYIKGIKSIEYIEKDTTIIVKYNPKKISIDKIRVEISKLGFDADSVPADPSAYEKLDACCKKRD